MTEIPRPDNTASNLYDNVNSTSSNVNEINQTKKLRKCFNYTVLSQKDLQQQSMDFYENMDEVFEV